MSLSHRMRRLGWMAFSVMWVPFATLMIGMGGMPDGSYAWSELPALARYSLIGVGLFGGLATILLVGSPLVSGMSNRRVLANGQPAEARILQISDTGTTVNNSFLVRFLLEVHPPGGTPFQAEVERLVNRLDVARIQPGSMVQVRYDPQTHAVALAN